MEACDNNEVIRMCMHVKELINMRERYMYEWNI